MSANAIRPQPTIVRKFEIAPWPDAAAGELKYAVKCDNQIHRDRLSKTEAEMLAAAHNWVESRFNQSIGLAPMENGQLSLALPPMALSEPKRKRKAA